MLSIGDLSRQTGVKVPTIRYYEQMGLISAPERSSGNQRRYTGKELERLSFIRHARELGLTIEAIRDLVKLSANPDMPCGEAHEIASQHLAVLTGRIAQLRKLKKELERITATCDAAYIGECYVIQALSDHGQCETEHD